MTKFIVTSARMVCSLFVFAAVSAAQTSYGRDAAGFLEALEETLASPAVLAGATAARLPLITLGNEVVAFHSGTQSAMANLCNAIRAAEHEILLQVYEWNDLDEAADMVRDALRDRIDRAYEQDRDAPLMIRVVLDHSWPARHTTPHHLLRALFQEVLRHDPEGQQVMVELNLRKGFAFSVVHAKYAVIDGKTLLLRTNNFLTLDGVARDFYNFSAQIVGPVASTVREDWLGLKAESTVDEAASHASYKWLDSLGELAAFLRASNCSKFDGPTDAQNSAMAVLAKNSRANFFTEGPPNPQNAGLLSLIEASEYEILSLNPALNVPAVKRAIEDAIVLRDVDVTLILSLNMNRKVQHRMQGGDNTDTLFEMYNNLLTRGGASAASHLHVRWASDGTGSAADENALGNNHAKTSLYDGEALWIGSMNWDWQSWSNSRELSVVIFNPRVAPRWQQTIWQPIWDKAAPLAIDDMPQCQGAKARRGVVCTFLQLH